MNSKMHRKYFVDFKTTTGDGEDIFIDAFKIEAIEKGDNTQSAIIHISSGSTFYVDEPINDVLERVTEVLNRM